MNNYAIIIIDSQLCPINFYKIVELDFSFKELINTWIMTQSEKINICINRHQLNTNFSFMTKLYGTRRPTKYKMAVKPMDTQHSKKNMIFIHLVKFDLALKYLQYLSVSSGIFNHQSLLPKEFVSYQVFFNYVFIVIKKSIFFVMI